MLSGILKKEDCAFCRFCCAFKRTSLWEVPVFTKENIESIKQDPDLDSSVLNVTESDGYIKATYDLSSNYKTGDPNEEAPCPYLGKNGCILSDNEKPWDCKIWPLRVMNKDNETVIALTPTCPSINKLELKDVKDYVDGIRNDLLKYAGEHPFLVKEYRADFPIV